MKKSGKRDTWGRCVIGGVRLTVDRRDKPITVSVRVGSRWVEVIALTGLAELIFGGTNEITATGILARANRRPAGHSTRIPALGSTRA